MVSSGFDIVHIGLYCALLLMGFYFLKQYYADNEGVSVAAGLFYTIIFCLFVGKLLDLMKGDPFNLPFLAILSTPVIAVSAIFFANFFSQLLTMKEFFQGNVRFNLIDYLGDAARNIQKSNYPRAIESYRKYLELHPDDYQVHMEIAEIYALYLFDYQSAILEYSYALEKSGINQESILIINRLADLYYGKLNSPHKAQYCLEEIARHWPGTKAAQNAAERIAGMGFPAGRNALLLAS